MSRVLVFSPYASRPHLIAYEGTIAKGCQLRGAQVEYLLCDGLLPECDMHWDSFPGNYPRPFDLCQNCRSGAASRVTEFDLPYRWIGQFTSETERENAFTWAQSLSPSEIPNATFKGYPIGEWVLSSVVSYFRQYPPDMDNWHVVNVYRGFVFGASIVTMALRKYLEENAIDSALLFNGRQSITRVAFHILQESGIRLLTHEYPFYQDGHLMLKPNARCWSPGPFNEFWRVWAQVPLYRFELEKTLKWLIDRRYGRGLSWYAFNAPHIQHVAIRKHLNVSQNKRLLALFTSSIDETVGDQELQGPYETQAVWVQDVVHWVRDRNDAELVIRVHPHLSGNTGLGKALAEYNFYGSLKAASPTNTTVVMPDDPLNSYALMDEADIGLSYGSSAGIEMAMLGKPVVLASRAFYENGAYILTLRSRQALSEVLEKSLQPFPTRELMREAFRLAYRYVFDFELEFPLVSKRGVMDVELNYTSAEALSPGKDRTLDRICKYLVEGVPLHYPPTDAERSRDADDEDAFFESLERSPGYLRNTHYDRWLPRIGKIKRAGKAIRRGLEYFPVGADNNLIRRGRSIFHGFLNWLTHRMDLHGRPARPGEDAG